MLCLNRDASSMVKWPREATNEYAPSLGGATCSLASVLWRVNADAVYTRGGETGRTPCAAAAVVCTDGCITMPSPIRRANANTSDCVDVGLRWVTHTKSGATY